jgi:hypothetical protein
MNKKLVTLAIGSVLYTVCNTALAAPFNSFDPRSMAMGGAGAAVANTSTAPFFNPSLLAVTREEDVFALEAPIVGVRLYDPEDAADTVDTIQDDYIDPISSLVNAINATPSNSERDQLVTLSDGLNGELNALNEAPLQGEAGAAVVLGVPSKTFGMAFSASGWGTMGGIVHYRDSAYLDGFNSAIAGIDFDTPSNNNEADLIAASDYLDYTTDAGGNVTSITLIDPTDQLESSVEIRGVLLRELGLSVAREFAISGATFALGVTPKLVTTTVYDYQATVDEADDDDIDKDDYSEEYRDINLDIGVAKNYNNGWRTGFVIKNLIKHEYDTYRRNPSTGVKEKTGNTVELKPQARLGISYQTERYTAAMDLDLTENDPIGFEEKSRYVALGGEFNMADWAQLRAGYRINTSEGGRNIPSLGLGLSPLGIHFDLAVARNADETAASAQFGFRF